MPRLSTVAFAFLSIGLFALGAERMTAFVIDMRHTDTRQDDQLDELQQQVRDLRRQLEVKDAHPKAGDDDNTVHRIAVDGLPSKGPADAAVTIVAFLDYQCPFCSRVQTTLRDLLTQNPDVRLVVENNPLPFHPNAMPAAMAATCAAEQGSAAFWAVHDRLYADQQNLARMLGDDAGAVWSDSGLDVARLNACRNDELTRSRVQEQMHTAQSEGAQGTPSFFVNGKKLTGAQPLEAFQKAVDAARADVRASGVDAAHYYDRVILMR